MDRARTSHFSGRRHQNMNSPWVKMTMVVLVVVGALFWIMNSCENAVIDAEKRKETERQARIVVALVDSFQVLAGRVPRSLVDQLPDGHHFVDIFPTGNCFINPWTGHRSEPRFFNHCYDKAQPGTLAIVEDNGDIFILAYGSNSRSTLRLRL